MFYDFRARSDASRYFDDKPSLTKQSFKDHCDMNNILRKYTRAGINPFVITQNAKFGDFTDIPNYAEALNLVIDAGNSFMSLPATIRRRFLNDPAQLLSFLQDPANLDEAISLGLLEKKSPASPVSGDAFKETA